MSIEKDGVIIPEEDEQLWLDRESIIRARSTSYETQFGHVSPNEDMHYTAATEGIPVWNFKHKQAMHLIRRAKLAMRLSGIDANFDLGYEQSWQKLLKNEIPPLESPRDISVCPQCRQPMLRKGIRGSEYWKCRFDNHITWMNPIDEIRKQQAEAQQEGKQ